MKLVSFIVEGGPSSDTASSNVGQAEVAAPDEKKTKEKPKPKRKYVSAFEHYNIFSLL